MNLLDYINNPLRVEDSIDKAMESLDSMCIATYTTSTPQKDSIILKKRFGIETCFVEENTLVVPITSEMVNLNMNDTILDEIEKIGLDKNNFEI